MARTTNGQAAADQLKAALDRIKELEGMIGRGGRVKKEESQFFHNGDGQPMPWRNLSETKKFLETNAPDVMSRMVRENRGPFQSGQFHQKLVQKLRECYGIGA